MPNSEDNQRHNGERKWHPKNRFDYCSEMNIQCETSPEIKSKRLLFVQFKWLIHLIFTVQTVHNNHGNVMQTIFIILWIPWHNK